MRYVIIFFSLAFANPLCAEELLGEYVTFISAEDRVNSSGSPLKSFGAFVAQDRANFHRFGKRDKLDGDDPVFHDRQHRAAIPSLLGAGGVSEPVIVREAMSGEDVYIFVRIFGRGGVPTRLTVHHGAG